MYEEPLPPLTGWFVFGMEYLPGQYDQRADSAAQCVQILSQGEAPLIRTAKIYALKGVLSQAEQRAVESYCINPIGPGRNGQAGNLGNADAGAAGGAGAGRLY